MDTIDPAKIDRVERKLSALRGIANATKSQILMLLSELGNLERAIAALRPGGQPQCPSGCGPLDRMLFLGDTLPHGYRCPNCTIVLPACAQCGSVLTSPRRNDPYGPDAPATTDCGGDCLACQRRTEVASGDPQPAGTPRCRRCHRTLQRGENENGHLVGYKCPGCGQSLTVDLEVVT